MSNWKLFLDKSHEGHNTSLGSNNSHSRFTPRRDADTRSPKHLHNASIDNQSSERGGVPTPKNSKSNRKYQRRSASQRKFHDIDSMQITNMLSYEIHEYGRYPLGQKKNIINNWDKGRFEECMKNIEKLKDEFLQFRQVVWQQLRKQEEVIYQMMADIVASLNSSSSDGNRTNQPKIEKPMFTIPSLAIQRSQTQVSAKRQIAYGQRIFPEAQHSPRSSKKNKETFDRFFVAVEALKDEVKELSDLHYIQSPRSARNVKFTAEKPVRAPRVRNV